MQHSEQDHAGDLLVPLLEAVRDYAIFALDASGRVATWNVGAERINGYAAEEILGRHFSVFYPEEPRRCGHPEEELRLTIANGRYEEEGFRVRKDGTQFWANVVITPIRNPAGHVIGFAKVTRDLSERRRMESSREAMVARLRKSNRDLQEFAMVAAHDIQEPLRKIQMFSQQLRAEFGDGLPPDALDYLNRMQRAADRGRALVQGLLTYSRITSHAQPLTATSLGEVVHDVVQDLEAQIAAVSGTVIVGDLPTVHADPVQMRQLFQNLVGNALKFHREGVPPVVHVTSAPADVPHAAGAPHAAHASAARAFRITVTDNGVGFDEKYLDRIFKLFQRLHAHSAYEGSGMGLAICRRIVERHGGTIDAHSAPGQGASFVIDLPEQGRDVEEA